MPESFRRVLALDIATNTGWCFGVPGESLKYGSARFGPAGSSHAYMYDKAMTWIAEMIQVFSPNVLAIEAPLQPQFAAGKTNIGTVRLLMGLVAVIEGTAHKFGVQDIRELRVQQVRKHFLGRGNIPGQEAKRRVMARCRALSLLPLNDNEGDSIALWYTAAGVAVAE